MLSNCYRPGPGPGADTLGVCLVLTSALERKAYRPCQPDVGAEVRPQRAPHLGHSVSDRARAALLPQGWPGGEARGLERAMCRPEPSLRGCQQGNGLLPAAGEPVSAGHGDTSGRGASLPRGCTPKGGEASKAARPQRVVWGLWRPGERRAGRSQPGASPLEVVAAAPVVAETVAREEGSRPLNSVPPHGHPAEPQTYTRAHKGDARFLLSLLCPTLTS